MNGQLSQYKQPYESGLELQVQIQIQTENALQKRYQLIKYFLVMFNKTFWIPGAMIKQNMGNLLLK